MSGVAACGGAGRGYDHYTGASRSVPTNSVSHNYIRIIRHMRRYKNIPKKDGTLKSHAMAYSQSLVYIYVYIQWK